MPNLNTTFSKSFFLNSIICTWNSLDVSIKTSISKGSLNKKLCKLYSYETYIFNHDCPRQIQVTFSQIRMGFSNLNNDLYKKGCVDNDICSCGTGKEDARHYMLTCQKYGSSRDTLYQDIKSCCNRQITLPLLLYGNKTLSKETNLLILAHVYQYIKDTNRF